MAQGASDALKVPQSTNTKARSTPSSVEGLEAEIQQTRGRLSVTLAALESEVATVLNPDIPLRLGPSGTRDAAYSVAVVLRSARQLTTLVRERKSGGVWSVAAMSGVALFLIRFGLAWRRARRRS